MNHYFTDLHIHIGATAAGQWVKIPTSRQLTVGNICEHSLRRKGMDIIGLVDAMSPIVMADIKQLINEGRLILLPGGGYQYDAQLTVLLGAEIETIEPQGGMVHTLIFLPDCDTMQSFSSHMAQYIRNINLSSQNARMPLARLVQIAADYDGLIIPAHVFTPYKSIYGATANRLSELLPDRLLARVGAIELGLSADSDMADRIGELAQFSFVTNSDAHSLDKIGREYTVLRLQGPYLMEVIKGLSRHDGRHAIANYGLDPRLGKYHRTFCEACGYVEQAAIGDYAGKCCSCGSGKVVKGVFERINEISDYTESRHPSHRPVYQYQIPLEFIPGLGKKALQKLLDYFGTEMRVLHEVTKEELCAVVGSKLAAQILNARAGTAVIQVGGGGIYGKMIP